LRGSRIVVGRPGERERWAELSELRPEFGPSWTPGASNPDNWERLLGLAD
jgi:hypothetical protein